MAVISFHKASFGDFKLFAGQVIVPCLLLLHFPDVRHRYGVVGTQRFLAWASRLCILSGIFVRTETPVGIGNTMNTRHQPAKDVALPILQKLSFTLAQRHVSDLHG